MVRHTPPDEQDPHFNHSAPTQVRFLCFVVCHTPPVQHVTPHMQLAIFVFQLLPFSALSYDISSLLGFVSVLLLSLSCISYHVIMCITFAYVFVSCIQAFSPLSVLHSGTPMSSGVPFYLFSCVGVKHFRIGPRLAKRPWFTTGRPPVKFRTIWTSFDTPTVNRGTKKASCVLQPNTSFGAS